MKYLLLAILISCSVQLKAEVEPLWTYSETSFSSYPAVHPNGNVLIGDAVKGDVIELNGLTGELIRRIPIAISDFSYLIRISKDGTRLLIMNKVLDYHTLAVIKDNIPDGLYVQFLNPRNDMLVMKMTMGIVTFNLNDGKMTEYPLQFPSNSFSTTAMEISNDGKYLALAQRDFKDVYHTHFYLYNAEKMTLIEELEDVAGEGRTIAYIQFSETSKYVGYGHNSPGSYKATLFPCKPPYIKKEFKRENFPPHGMKGIGFVKDEYAFLSYFKSDDEKGSILFEIEPEKVIYQTNIYTSSIPLFNKKNNTILVWTKNLVALNLEKILSSVSVTDNKPIDVFKAEYKNRTLNISYEFKSPTLNIQILNLQGNLVFKKVIPSQNQIMIPINLSGGVYFVRITDGKQEYSQKFIIGG